jgi:hypothetical protein
MARDVEADVNVNDKSDKGLKSFLSNLRNTVKGTKDLEKELDKAGSATQKLGGKADANVKAFHKLSSELAISKKELGSLAQAFANAGTAAERTDISKAMRRQQQEISRLSKNRDILKDLIPDQEVKNLTGRLTESLEQVSAVAPQIIGAGIAAAAPLAASLLSAGIIGGAGLGGIVGGVVLASKDPRVQGAFAAMKDHIGTELTDSAKPFVDTTIHGIDAIGSALDTIDFKDVFAESARNAEPIIDGIASGIQGIGDGVEALIANSGPVMEQLGASIAELGQHAGEFLKSISGGSQGAAAGLKDVTDTVDNLLDILGPSIEGLTTLYGWLSKIGLTGHLLAALEGPIGLIQEGLKSAGITGEHASGQLTLAKKGLDSVAAAAAAGADPLATFTDKVDDLASSGRSLFDSTTQVGAAIDTLTEAAKKNGKTLDANTEKGRANRDALSGLAGALVSNYDAYVKVNGEGVKSNGIAAANRSQFVKLAGQFGISSRQAETLATKMGLIPAKKKTDFTANTHDAEARAEALKEKINGIPISKTVRITLVANVNAAINKVNNALGSFSHLFADTESFQFAAPGATVRTEPARQVDVASTVTNQIFLDGKPFRDFTDRRIKAGQDRAAWRQKVGRR